MLEESESCLTRDLLVYFTARAVVCPFLFVVNVLAKLFEDVSQDSYFSAKYLSLYRGHSTSCLTVDLDQTTKTGFSVMCRGTLSDFANTSILGLRHSSLAICRCCWHFCEWWEIGEICSRMSGDKQTSKSTLKQKTTSSSCSVDRHDQNKLIHADTTHTLSLLCIQQIL